MKIISLKDLDMKQNSIFVLWYKLDESLLVVNIEHKKTVLTITELEDVDELKLYGFDVKVLRKADLGVVESVANQYNVSLNYIRGKWYYSEGRNLLSLDSLLVKEGYYIWRWHSLDFTSGSGTTAVACENTNRRWICIEKDTDDKGNILGYCDITVERLKGVNRKWKN